VVKAPSFRRKTALANAPDEKRKSIVPMLRLEKKDTYDFDIILQDIDDLPETTVVKTRANRVKLRNNKKSMNNTQSQSQTHGESLVGMREKLELSDFLSDEEVDEKAKPTYNEEQRELILMDFKKRNSNSSSDDMLNDSDFLEEDRSTKTKELTLAHLIFKNRYMRPKGSSHKVQR
jgi:hypothetical protein